MKPLSINGEEIIEGMQVTLHNHGKNWKKEPSTVDYIDYSKQLVYFVRGGISGWLSFGQCKNDVELLNNKIWQRKCEQADKVRLKL